MADRDLVQIYGGQEATIPNLAQRQLGLTSDTESLFAGGQFGNMRVGRKIRDVSVFDHGAKGDGVTDDSVAIQNAINASVGKVLLIPNTGNPYIISTNLNLVDNIIIVSDGATLKGGAVRFLGGYLKGFEKDNIVIKGLNFDLNVSAYPTYLVGDYPNRYNIGIELSTCENTLIEDCHFSELYTQAIYSTIQKGLLTIKECTFDTPLQLQNLRMEFIEINTTTATIEIKNSRFVSPEIVSIERGVSGIYTWSNTGLTNIHGNYFENIGRNNGGGHRLGNIDLYDNCENVEIYNNKHVGINWNWGRVNGSRKVNVYNNFIGLKTVSNETVVGVGSPFEATQTKHVHIFNNIIDASESIGNVFGVGGGVEFYHRPFVDIKVYNNTFINIYGGVVFNGNIEGLEIYDNKAIGGFVFADFQLYNLPDDSVLDESETTISGFVFRGNIVENHKQLLNIFLFGYTGSLPKLFVVDDNQCVGDDSGSIVVTNGVNVKAVNNVITNGTNGLNLKNCAIVYVYQNNMYDCPTALNTSLGVVTVVQNNNYDDDVLIV